jgi:2-dehydropantoate 2-reductase
VTFNGLQIIAELDLNSLTEGGKRTMKVIVAGAGSLGSLLGGLLARTGEDVLLLGRQAHVSAVQQDGLRVTGILGNLTIPMGAKTELNTEDGPADLVILGAKSQDVASVLQMIEPIVGDDTQILSPQNGVVTEDLVEEAYGANRSLPAVTPINVSLARPGELYYAIAGPLQFGPRGDQNETDVQPIIEAFNKAGIETTWREDIMELKWRKLARYSIGAIINALTGLQRLGDDEDVRELMRDLAEELIAVVEAGNVTDFPIRPLVEEAYRQWEGERAEKAWLASVGQDLRKGKTITEIDYINGYVVKLGREHHVPTPVNHCIYTLVKAIASTGYLKQVS